MKRRIFVAINLPEKIKKRLKEYREKLDYLPARWTKEQNLHLTLVFIGYVDDEQMLEICRAARGVAGKTEPFFVNFQRIILGPVGKVPKMIWLEGRASDELGMLKKELEKSLLADNTGFYKPETRVITPHITLARMKMGKWRRAQIDASDLSVKYSLSADIETDFLAQVEVSSIEVMESSLKFNGAEYTTLESCPLG